MEVNFHRINNYILLSLIPASANYRSSSIKKNKFYLLMDYVSRFKSDINWQWQLIIQNMK